MALGDFSLRCRLLEGLSLPSLLRGTGIEGASLGTGDGGYLPAFFQLLLPIFVHIIPQSELGKLYSTSF